MLTAGAALAAGAASAGAVAGASSPDFNPTVLSPGLPIAHTFTNTGTSSPSL